MFLWALVHMLWLKYSNRLMRARTRTHKCIGESAMNALAMLMLVFYDRTMFFLLSFCLWCSRKFHEKRRIFLSSSPLSLVDLKLRVFWKQACAWWIKLTKKVKEQAMNGDSRIFSVKCMILKCATVLKINRKLVKNKSDALIESFSLFSKIIYINESTQLMSNVRQLVQVVCDLHSAQGVNTN